MASITMQCPHFWYVTYSSDKARKVIVPRDSSRDVRAEIAAGQLGRTWIAAPYNIVGHGSWPDWMAFWIPLISERAISVLGALIDDACELIPWIEQPSHRYSLVKVNARIPRTKWESQRSTSHSGELASADVISISEARVPSIFQLEGYSGKTFVSDEVANKSVAEGLSGVAFVDPLIPELDLPFMKRDFGKRHTGFVRLDTSGST